MKVLLKIIVLILTYILFSWLVMYFLDREYALSYKYLRFAILSSLLYVIVMYFIIRKKC